jgi:uncharacterized protein with ParB-like and HNH nuclease domain
MKKNDDMVNFNQPQMLNIVEIFNNVEYVVPIYQRNYAWEKDQIEQLIQDILDVPNEVNSYYLGCLIVNKLDGTRYEVIDGQQRLTTLYLTMFCLSRDFSHLGEISLSHIQKGALSFEAREKSNDTLQKIQNKQDESIWVSDELKSGYSLVFNYLKQKINKSSDFAFFSHQLEKVKIARVQVPKEIDLNHYFEIMNTRGEQLTPDEIAKARILGMIRPSGEKVVKAAAKIWEACAIMDSYVQMNFDTNSRKRLFGETWMDLKCNSFDEAISLCNLEEEKKTKKKNDDTDDCEQKDVELLAFLETKAVLEEKRVTKEADKEEQERFESVISFSNFLLHVNALTLKDSDNNLDDKFFLENLKHNWSDAESAKNFIYCMLKCRYLLDKYIIKREFYKDYRNEGRWMLQGIKAYKDEKKNTLKPQYFGTYNTSDYSENEDKTKFDTEKTKRIRTLEACLRITYTSPKMMHWITNVLRLLYENETADLIRLLEDYCRKKVDESDYANKTGFQIERIVFTYLDYLLWRSGFSLGNEKIIGKMDFYQYQYRNSIEHFSPQHPSERKAWEDADLNSFGNLALVTVSGNSLFSNNEPIGKVKKNESIIKQSLKLTIMAEMTKKNNGEWTQDMAKEHREAMLNVLQEDLNLMSK